jgi:hypothetical protein
MTKTKRFYRIFLAALFRIEKQSALAYQAKSYNRKTSR